MWKLLALLCLAAVNMHAAATEIRDTAYTAFNGVLFSGKLTITGPDMTTVDDRTVHRWEQAYTITNGAISLDLEPNDTATPAGTSYLVRFTPAKGAAWTERWIIPTNVSPLKVHQVRVQTVPLPSLTIQPAQISPIGAAKGDLIGFGTSWGPLSGGTNGQVLAKDATAARGLAWVAPDSGPPGPAGPAGANGAAGAQGPPGVVAATPPITYDGDTDTVACPTCSVSGHGHTAAGDATGDLGTTVVNRLSGADSSYVKGWVKSGSGPTFSYMDIRPPSTADINTIRFYNADGTVGLPYIEWMNGAPAALYGFSLAGVPPSQPSTYARQYQGASIPTTDACPDCSTGLALISYWLATDRTGTSGTVSLTINWSNYRYYGGGKARTFTTSTVDLTSYDGDIAGSFVVYTDAPTHPITFSTTATNLGGQAKYAVHVGVTYLTF